MLSSLVTTNNHVVDEEKLEYRVVKVKDFTVELVKTGEVDGVNEVIAIFEPGTPFGDTLSVVDISDDTRSFDELANVLLEYGKDTASVWPVIEYDIAQYTRFRSKETNARRLNLSMLPFKPTNLFARLSNARPTPPKMGGVLGRDDAVSEFYEEFGTWRKTPWSDVFYTASKTRELSFTIKGNEIRLHKFNKDGWMTYNSETIYDDIDHAYSSYVDKTYKHMCLQLIAVLKSNSGYLL